MAMGVELFKARLEELETRVEVALSLLAEQEVFGKGFFQDMERIHAPMYFDAAKAVEAMWDALRLLGFQSRIARAVSSILGKASEECLKRLSGFVEELEERSLNVAAAWERANWTTQQALEYEFLYSKESESARKAARHARKLRDEADDLADELYEFLWQEYRLLFDWVRRPGFLRRYLPSVTDEEWEFLPPPWGVIDGEDGYERTVARALGRLREVNEAVKRRKLALPDGC